MAARKKKTRLSTVLLRVGFVAVVAYLVGMLISTQVEIVAKRQQLANLEQQAQTQAAANLELERTLASDNEDAYIERIARDKLGYALPNERIYVDMSGQ